MEDSVSLYRKLVPEPNGRRLARHLKSGQIEAYSAGVEPQGLNSVAVRVMEEAGVDMSRQRSKHVDELQRDRIRPRRHRL